MNFRVRVDFEGEIDLIFGGERNDVLVGHFQDSLLQRVDEGLEVGVEELELGSAAFSNFVHDFRQNSKLGPREFPLLVAHDLSV